MNAKFVAVVFVTIGMALLAQQPQSPPTSTPAKKVATMQLAENQQPDSDNDIDMENWINLGDNTVDRLVSLGVEQRISESLNSDIVGVAPAIVTWQKVRSLPRERLALLFFPCHVGWDFAYLYSVGRQNKSWHVTDRIELDCHYDDSVSFEITRIRDPNSDEIMVHHACAGHGTGYLAQNFSVFTLSSGDFKAELETTEVLHSHPPEVDLRRDLDQNSKFTVIPIKGSRFRAIEETRSSVLNGELTVRRRIFRWNIVRMKYIPSAFTPVEASSAGF